MTHGMPATCRWERHHEDYYMDEHIYMWFKTECGRDYYESLVDSQTPENEDFMWCPWCRGDIEWR